MTLVKTKKQRVNLKIYLRRKHFTLNNCDEFLFSAKKLYRTSLGCKLLWRPEIARTTRNVVQSGRLTLFIPKRTCESPRIQWLAESNEKSCKKRVSWILSGFSGIRDLIKRLLLGTLCKQFVRHQRVPIAHNQNNARLVLYFCFCTLRRFKIFLSGETHTLIPNINSASFSSRNHRR